MGDSKDSKKEKTGSESTEKKGFMSRVARGVGALIQGAVESSDRALSFAEDSREKSANGVLGRRKKRRKENPRKLPSVRNLFKENSNFSEEQKKELAAILEQQLSEMKNDEYEDLTEEQEDDDDDGYFGVTDPGLTTPTMTMGLRNSFGEFFGTAADAMESRDKRRESERKNSIYR